MPTRADVMCDTDRACGARCAMRGTDPARGARRWCEQGSRGRMMVRMLFSFRRRCAMRGGLTQRVRCESGRSGSLRSIGAGTSQPTRVMCDIWN
eukprot:2312614-Rhodomonas_salina.8